MTHTPLQEAGRGLATAALAAGLTMAGTGTAQAAVTPPAGPRTWAEIFAPEINSNGITLCADNFGSTAQGHNLQLWRCHGYASDGTPQRWDFSLAQQNRKDGTCSTRSKTSARVSASG